MLTKKIELQKHLIFSYRGCTCHACDFASYGDEDENIIQSIPTPSAVSITVHAMQLWKHERVYKGGEGMEMQAKLKPERASVGSFRVRAGIQHMHTSSPSARRNPLCFTFTAQPLSLYCSYTATAYAPFSKAASVHSSCRQGGPFPREIDPRRTMQAN